MKIKYLLSLSLFTGVSFASSPEVIAEYIKIQDTLASDSVNGVVESAKKIATIEKSSKVGLEAQKVAAAKDIKSIRESFKLLSKEVIASTPKKDLKDVKVAGCPMANAQWLQKGDKIRNPYYGASMLECGSFE